MEQQVQILLVEDEETIADFLQAEFEEGGFGVHVVNSGTAALEELARDAAQFHALITDVNLGPGPTGWEVARQARELSNDIAVVYMTGGNGHEWRANGVPQSVLLQKPFAAAQVLAAVTTVLNSNGKNAVG